LVDFAGIKKRSFNGCGFGGGGGEGEGGGGLNQNQKKKNQKKQQGKRPAIGLMSLGRKTPCLGSDEGKEALMRQKK